jgi:hypothetical protein
LVLRCGYELFERSELSGQLQFFSGFGKQLPRIIRSLQGVPEVRQSQKPYYVLQIAVTSNPKRHRKPELGTH